MREITAKRTITLPSCAIHRPCKHANNLLILHGARVRKRTLESKAEFPSLGQLAGVGACVRADVLLCVHSHARRHNSER